MSVSPPLRFLGIVLGGWVCARAALLVPPLWEVRPDVPRDLSSRKATARPLKHVVRAPWGLSPQGDDPLLLGKAEPLPGIGPQAPLALSLGASPAPLLAGTALASPRFEPNFAVPAPVGGPGLFTRPGRFQATSRWSVSGWAFLRRGEGTSLAGGGGTLGASQLGARFSYRLNESAGRPLAISARFTAPRRRHAAEAALGVDWKPFASLPFHFVAERRQALGREARSAFALAAYGGLSDARILGRFRLDAYGQAGVVGARSRDLFADGAVRLSVPVSRRLRLGGGVWGAAQPGLARLDFGPQASLRLPLDGTNVVVAVDWRLRAAGNARPGSGPSVTLSTDF